MNRACHYGWGNYPDMLFVSQFTATHFNGLAQDCRNSSALAMELLQSCSNPSIWNWGTCRWNMMMSSYLPMRCRDLKMGRQGSIPSNGPQDGVYLLTAWRSFSAARIMNHALKYARNALAFLLSLDIRSKQAMCAFLYGNSKTSAVNIYTWRSVMGNVNQSLAAILL